MALSVNTLVRCGVPREKARAHLPHMASAMREHGITTRRRARMFIAQVMHESAALRYFEEIASGAAYEGRRDLGNTHRGDGRRFKGRGPIQLTGRNNYTLYGKLLGIDLVRRPEAAATPRVGWRTAAMYFQRAGCNQAADRGDFRRVTRLINGGYNGYDDRVRYFRLLEGAGVVPGEAYLSRGDRGDAVVTMTRRLSFLRSKKTGEPYLDGRRGKFDREAVVALRRFQAEHGLKVDGRFGPSSAKKLAVAVAREKVRRKAARIAAEKRRREGGSGGGLPPAPVPKPSEPDSTPGRTKPRRETTPATAMQLLAAIEQLDTRSDRLRTALLERGRALERALADATVPDLAALAEQLGRLDEMIHDVGATIARREHLQARTVAAERAAAAPPSASRPAERPRFAREGAVAAAPVATAEGPASSASESAANGAATGNGGGGTDTALGLAELLDRLGALDSEEARIRELLAERFAELEGLFAPPARPAVESATEDAPPDPLPPKPVEHPRDRAKRKKETGKGKRPDVTGEPGGGVVATRLGDRGHSVRQSKVAIARYLHAKRPGKAKPLRRALQREARSPKNGKLATATWQRGVKRAQRIAGLPVTGELDGPLHRVLRGHWPSDAVMRRVIRATPAWRAIPGQLTPNFNLREFGCKDGTGYIEGLVREKGVSRADARRRAKGLAQRLERVRKMNGGRPLRLTSVYRTERYNATLRGSAKNSAHTRGYAADQPPPAGITMEQQRRHVRASFEAGVGFYPSSHFVHGDFDPALGRRSWTG